MVAILSAPVSSAAGTPVQIPMESEISLEAQVQGRSTINARGSRVSGVVNLPISWLQSSSASRVRILQAQLMTLS